jgi:hypothetical protein
MRPNAGCYSSPAGLGGHGRGVMQRGIVGRLSPATFAVSQSNSTFFHSAGESNDARRHLNFVDKNVVFSPANLVPRNETYSPVKLASSNELFLPPNLAPSNEVRRERNFAPVNAVSEFELGVVEPDVVGAEPGAVKQGVLGAVCRWWLPGCGA